MMTSHIIFVDKNLSVDEMKNYNIGQFSQFTKQQDYLSKWCCRYLVFKKTKDLMDCRLLGICGHMYSFGAQHLHCYFIPQPQHWHFSLSENTSSEGKILIMSLKISFSFLYVLISHIQEIDYLKMMFMISQHLYHAYSKQFHFLLGTTRYLYFFWGS